MSTRSFQTGDGFGLGFTIKSATGALVNADALPVATLYRNGALDSAVTVTVAALSTGNYSATCTIPGTYVPGDRVSLFIAATIGGVATGEYVDHIRLVGWPNTTGAAGSLATVANLAASGPLIAGTAVAGSTAQAIILSGLPAGRNYIGQHLYHQVDGESRVIAAQTVASGNYTFTMGTGANNLGPFSVSPTAGDLFSPIT